MDIKNKDAWLEFYKTSWDTAGRPIGLDPASLLNNPFEFDRSYYNYFERRYMDMWLSIYSRVNPDSGILFTSESVELKEAWQQNFDWNTIWKQTLPLLVYGTTLGASNEVLVELASWYCLGQAIPSMVVDRILDDDTNTKKNNSDVAFCILSYVKALKGLRLMDLPNSARFEDTFLHLTGEMYEKMFTEYYNRFKSLPLYISDAIREYLSPSSRLLSSVFFGILPIWAYALTNKHPSERIKESLIKLRMVRQLNDEILDVKEDLNHGLLTLPWLYALEHKPKLRKLIEIVWKKREGNTSIEECFQILERSSGRERTMKQSLEFLSQSMDITMECFRVEEAFEIALIHNVRWSLLNSLEQVKFKRDSNCIYNPSMPLDIILDNKQPIEPVPGSGVVVYNSAKKVLLTLVLKRGMLRWELPAGVSKTDESLEVTAKREALEETGKKVEICDAVASCWHFSRKLNKGWMGLFFKGNIINKNEDDHDKIIMVTPQAFSQNKFNIGRNPELYKSVNLSVCDFDELLSLCNCSSHPTVHESVIASGFVDWKQIPKGRIHPLHNKLLEDLELETDKSSMKFLYGNADEDFNSYDKNSKLYLNN